jgi:hypothetical protein
MSQEASHFSLRLKEPQAIPVPLPMSYVYEYERGWPSYFIVVLRWKNVDVRGVQICVRKLTANDSDCATSECLIFSSVTRDEGCKASLQRKYFPMSFFRVRKSKILNFMSARPLLSTLFVRAVRALLCENSLKMGGRWHKLLRRSPNIFRSEPIFTMLEHGFYDNRAS